jgi:hypothetical protein
MSTSQQSIMMPLMNWSSSISSSSDDDIESGYSSNEDSICNNSSAGQCEMAITVSKLMNNGKIPRRRSQCEQLSFRKPKKASQLLPQPSPSSLASSSSSSPKRKDTSYHLLMITSFMALLLFVMQIFVVSQQHVQVASLKLQLKIANQHRAFLEKSASDLHFKLTLRDTALSHCNDVHSRMLKDNLGQGDVMRTLRQELIESRIEVDQLKARDSNVARQAA